MSHRSGLDRVNDVIHGFYDAALEPERWPTALDGLGDLLGGCAIGTSLQLQRTAPQYLGYSRLDPTYTAVMAERYACIDTNPMVAAMRRLPPAVAFPRKAAKADEDYFGSGLYNEVFRPQGLVHAAVVCAYRSRDQFVPLGIFRRSTQEEFGDPEYALLARVLPHLEKALRAHMKIAVAEASQASLEQGLDALPFALFLLDHNGQVWKLNRMAEAIIHMADGLTLRRGELRTVVPAENRTLHGLIRTAIGIPVGSQHSSGGSLAVSRPSTARPLGVLVTPLPARSAWSLGQPGAIVFVTDPNKSSCPAAAVLAGVFDLTPSQAQLTSLLAGGLSIEEVATRLGIKASTARVHLKKVFEKTGTSRQADLVRTVLTSVAFASLIDSA